MIPPRTPGGLLGPYRDVLLLQRAKFMSYEQISATFARHGLRVSPAAVGMFCRRHLTKAEIERARKPSSSAPSTLPQAALRPSPASGAPTFGVSARDRSAAEPSADPRSPATTTETMHTPAKRIILFPQDKGGIGKSFVAALLHDYLTDERVRVKAFDLDHANSTFNRLVPEAEFIDTDVDVDKLGVLDRIVHALDDAETVLVDNRATGGSKVHGLP
jgi:hypothetical protein